LSRPGSRGARAQTWFRASSALGIVVAAFDAATAFALRGLLQREHGESAAGIIAVLLALVFGRGLSHLAFVSASQIGREALGESLRARFVDAMLDARSRTALTDSALHLADLHPRALAHAQLRAACFAYGAQGVLLAVAAVVIAPVMAIGTLAAIAVAGAAIFVLGRRITRRAEAVAPAQRAFLADVTRLVRTLPLVHALRLEPVERERVGRRIRDHASLARASASLGSLASALPALIGAPLLASCLALAISLGVGAATSIALLVVLVRVVLVGSTFAGTWAAMRASRPAYEQIESALSAERTAVTPAAPDGSPPRAEQASASRRPPALRGDALAVRAGHGRILFSGISFAVDGGEHLGVIGPSGSGKTTLIEAVLALRDVESGALSIDDREPADYLRASADGLGYLGPEPYLFAGTIRENLSIGGRRFGDATLLSALERVGLLDLVRGLPRGLDEAIGEDGAPLSSGERQRLALARALVHEPTLLVLDEPTAHVDPATEEVMLATVRALRGRATCVIAGHREELVAHCAAVVRLGAEPVVAETPGRG
jgi:ABC-type multidrug transport system fused ATPase/permease subunit